jgi:hypothetical protein
MSTGYKKDAGKLRYDLIPPEPMKRVAEVYTMGAGKYSPHNWRRGMAWSRVIGAAQRHLEAFRAGTSVDPIDGQHVLASVVWCALALMEYERTHPELDDRMLDGREIDAVEAISADAFKPAEVVSGACDGRGWELCTQAHGDEGCRHALGRCPGCVNCRGPEAMRAAAGRATSVHLSA